jgi:hypothetical protein
MLGHPRLALIQSEFIGFTKMWTGTRRDTLTGRLSLTD